MPELFAVQRKGKKTKREVYNRSYCFQNRTKSLRGTVFVFASLLSLAHASVLERTSRACRGTGAEDAPKEEDGGADCRHDDYPLDEFGNHFFDAEAIFFFTCPGVASAGQSVTVSYTHLTLPTIYSV